MSYIGAEQARALLGAWHEIVGWQEAGHPSNIHHGPYGGRHYGHRQQFAHGPAYGQAHPQSYYPTEIYPTQIYPTPEYPVQVYPAPHAPHSAHGYPAHGYPAHGYPAHGYPAHGYPAHGYTIPGHGGSSPSIVERPAPHRADRITLPMSSGVSIFPNTSAQITSRPQAAAFRPERIIIGGAPQNWIVNDVKVGNRSQFAQSGDVPGEMFAATTIDGFVSMETVQTAMDFVMVVTFVGDNQEGAPFVCGVLGTAAV
jgi:hypothetical protein